MIQKIQALQKRLIAKTEEAVEKDMLIQVGLGLGWGWLHRVCVWVGGAHVPSPATVWSRASLRPLLSFPCWSILPAVPHLTDQHTRTPTPDAQEKEKLYVELKNILARQPGPEVAEQVALYQGSLRDKTKQLKAMASELNMAQVQVRVGSVFWRGGSGVGRWRWGAIG